MRISDWSSDVCSSDLGDHLVAVGIARAQAALQLFHRRRQDEDAYDVGPRFLIELLRALPVDIEQHILARLEQFVDARARRAVTVAEDLRPFEELAVDRKSVV